MWIDLTNDLSPEGQDMLNIGDVLIYNFEGSKTYIKIMRKFKGKVWGKENYLYAPEEVEVKDKVE